MLSELFGNAFKISCAYIEKALLWPAIKSEEPRALQDFSLFLRSCCTAMEQLEYMEELDTISNMKNIIFKLPYKFREKWRSKACEIQLQRNTRVRKADLVTFIEKQATIVSDPVFGDIHDPTSSSKSKAPMKPISKGSFATHVDVRPTLQTPEHLVIPGKTDSVCIFCTGKHELMTCSLFQSKPHNEKITFLKQNGVCFGCLAKAGHLSRDCAKRLQCSVCNKQHPSVLHIKAKEASVRSIQVSVKTDRLSKINRDLKHLD
jgi:hypothetical protein